MLKNTYILYHDAPQSKKYLQDCIDSCKKFPDINPIPFAGPSNVSSIVGLRDYFDVNIIPYYMKEMYNKNIINSFACAVGHYLIWQEIVKTNEPSVIFEHDAVVKQDFTTLEPVDGEILWLGQRTFNMDDYTYPEGWETKYVEVDRWEGTHAYAITPKTAKMLLDYIADFGLNDSLDGQLGMRNMFDMRMRTIDPPPVVAVVSGDRQSTIDPSGNASALNAYSTKGFLAGLKAGAEPPVRQLYFTDNSFMKHTGFLNAILKNNGFYENKPLKVLVLGGEEGMSTLWLSNMLLRHDDSQLFCAGGFDNKNWQIFNFNTYFSKYYYKLNSINCNDVTDLLVASCADPDIRFDVVYINGSKNTTKDTVFNGIASYKMLRNGGIMIFNNYDHPIIKSGVDIFDHTVMVESLYKSEIAVYKC